MQIAMLNNSTFRIVLGSNELDTYYIQKGKTGAWKIAQKGQILDFASTRVQAINVAIALFKGELA